MNVFSAASAGTVPPSLAIAGAVIAFLIGLITLATVLGKGVRGVVRLGSRLTRVSDEILGDGDKRPGWGKRIESLESKLTAAGETDAAQSATLERVSARLGDVEQVVRGINHEVRPNGGSSLADTVNRIATATGAARTDQNG